MGSPLSLVSRRYPDYAEWSHAVLNGPGSWRADPRFSILATAERPCDPGLSDANWNNDGNPVVDGRGGGGAHADPLDG
jgi:hypothetical protein